MNVLQKLAKDSQWPCSSEYVDLLAQVIDVKGPRKSKGSDHVLVLKIRDGTMEGVVNIFRQEEADLPSFPQEKTDQLVISLRRFKPQRFEDITQFLSCKWSAWTVLYRREGRWHYFPESQNNPSPSLNALLSNKFSGESSNNCGVNHPRRDPKQKLVQCSELTNGIFVDINVQVLKILPPENFFQALVTDYTSNERVNYEPQSCESEEPVGLLKNSVLHLTVWDNFKPIAEQVCKEGECVFLRNVHCRENNIDGSLALTIHGDEKCTSAKDYICKSDEQQETILLKRKQQKLMLPPSIPTFSLTSVEALDIPYTSISDIQRTETVNDIYKVKALATDICEPLVVNGCFLFVLVLADHTRTKLPVIVADSDALEFLQMDPPATTLSLAEVPRLQRLCKSLLPSDFLIYSYQTKSQSQKRFRLFKTKLN